MDKPLASSYAEAVLVVEAAARSGVPLSVFHNRRWDSEFLTAARLVREGAAGGPLGRPLRFESRFDRWRPVPKAGAWRESADPSDGGGVLLDLGSHLVDQVCAAPTCVYVTPPPRLDSCAPPQRRRSCCWGQWCPCALLSLLWVHGPACPRSCVLRWCVCDSRIAFCCVCALRAGGCRYAESDVRRVGAAVDDDAFIALRHAGGARSHLSASTVAAHLAPRLRLLGSGGACVAARSRGCARRAPFE